MSQIRISNITNRAGTSGAVIAGVTSSIGTGYAKMVSGDNSERVGIESGSIRYNNTAKVLEFYDGTQWNFILPAEESANALGVFGGGYNAEPYFFYKSIDYITISTLGDATYFGDLTQTRSYGGACSSSTRGVFGGGFATPTTVNTIDYITIATTGNATDFGDLTVAREGLAACSSSTRGVWGGGFAPSISNSIVYITIATTGNSNTFGQLTQTRVNLTACSSSIRGVFSGGRNNTLPWTYYNTIDYITIATTGNATDFGDLTTTKDAGASCSSSTRGIFGGGYSPVSGGYQSKIEYFTIASTGNTIAFGDLTRAAYFLSACSSSTRGVFGGGILSGYVSTNTIDYITIATTGNATDFGDLTKDAGLPNNSALSNNHGGLL